MSRSRKREPDSRRSWRHDGPDFRNRVTAQPQRNFLIVRKKKGRDLGTRSAIINIGGIHCFVNRRARRFAAGYPPSSVF